MHGKKRYAGTKKIRKNPLDRKQSYREFLFEAVLIDQSGPPELILAICTTGRILA